MLLLAMGYGEASAQIKWRLPQIEVGKAKPPSNRFFVLGAGAGSLAFVDELSSPRRFSGVAASSWLGYEKQRTNRLFVTDFATQLSLASDNASNWSPNQAQALVFRWNLAWMWATREADKALQWYVGPVLLQYGAVRINTAHGNGAVAYEQSYNVGGRSRLEYRLPLQTRRDYQWWIFKVRKVETRAVRLGWELDLPVFGWQFRPPYNGILDGVGNDPIGAGARDMLNNSRLEVAGQYFYLNNHFYLRYPLRNGNRLQLSYNWQAYSRTYLDMPVRQASGVVMASMLFRLDNREDIR